MQQVEKTCCEKKTYMESANSIFLYFNVFMLLYSKLNNQEPKKIFLIFFFLLILLKIKVQWFANYFGF